MFTKEILGSKVDFDIQMPEVLSLIENKLLKDDCTHYICTTNPEFLIAATKNPDFQRIINDADLSLPDGSGVLFARKYLESLHNLPKSPFYFLEALYNGISLGLRSLIAPSVIGTPVTGVSLVYNLAQLSSDKGYTIFLLGGWPKDRSGKRLKGDINLASEAGAKLKELYPNVHIIGATSKFTPKEVDDTSTIEYIQQCMKEHNISSIDFLFVAYNHWFQEAWIKRNAHLIPAKVSVGVGGTFDYIAGYEKDTPRNFASFHLGWLYRLVTQPWRIKRIFTAFPLFPLKVYLQSLKER